MFSLQSAPDADILSSWRALGIEMLSFQCAPDAEILSSWGALGTKFAIIKNEGSMGYHSRRRKLGEES